MQKLLTLVWTNRKDLDRRFLSFAVSLLVTEYPNADFIMPIGIIIPPTLIHKNACNSGTN